MTVYDTIRNMIGRIQVELAQMSALLAILENPNSTLQEKAAARTTIKQCCLNIIKMENTLAAKAGYTLTLSSTAYTDQELTDMRCKLNGG